MPLPKNMPPAWVYKNAKYDLDFANQRWWGGTVWLGSTTSTTRIPPALMMGGNSIAAGGRFYQDTDGVWRGNPTSFSLPINKFGLWAEGYGTYRNWILHSRDLANAAWTNTNITATRNQTGANGVANSATLLSATAGNGTCTQGITRAAEDYVGSAIIRRVTGTGVIEMTIDNGTTWTDVTSQIGSSYAKVVVPFQNLANPTIGFRIATSGDEISVDLVQLENNRIATSPAATTTASVQAGPATSYVNTVGGVTNSGLQMLLDINAGTPATVRVEFSANFDPTYTSLLYGDNSTSLFITTSVDGADCKVESNANTVSTANAPLRGLNNINRLMTRITGESSGLSICLNGGAIATSTGSFSNDTDINHGVIGTNGSGIRPLNGVIRRLTLWNRGLSDAEMVAFSS